MLRIQIYDPKLFILRCFFILLFCFSSEFSKAGELTGCLLISKNTKLFSKESTRSEFISIDRGRILPLTEQPVGTTFFQSSYLGKTYWVLQKDVRRGSSNLCTLRPKCFEVRNKTKVYDRPNTSSNVISEVSAEKSLDWLGQVNIKQQRQTWYQVRVGETYGWLNARSGVLSDKICKDSLLSNQKNYFIHLDGGMGQSYSTRAYELLLTSVPDPDSVSCLQDPIVTGIEKGKSLYAAATFNQRFLENFGFRGGLGFEQVEYVLLKKNNPHPNPGTNCNTHLVTLAQLQSGSETIKESNLIVPIGLFADYFFSDHLGVSLNVDFTLINSMAEGFLFTYFTDNIYKRFENKMQINPTKIRFDQSAELRLFYKFTKDPADTYGTSLFLRYNASQSMIYGLSLTL